MTITLLQQDIVWSQPQANWQAAEATIASAPVSDLYILPEMWDTGFMPMGPQETEGQADATLQWMQQMARRMDAAIAGSVAVRDGGRNFNRLYFVKPDGTFASYDKHHLFSYAREDEHYKAGRERVIVEWRGMRFLLQVCYDLRFPVFSRNGLSGNGPDEALYDCILYVASWPESRRQVWDVLLRARAIENQCYVMGVNRTGSDTACQYNGGTQAIDAYGRVMALCADGEAGYVTVQTDMEKLRTFRKKFPVLSDADGWHNTQQK